jgi:AcrR family transcriptional regulator
VARTLSESAREKMLGAATEVVLDMGVARFSIDEVARRSGVAKTTIYRHFPNAKVLLVAALDRVMQAPPTPDTGSLRGDLREYLEAVLPGFADQALRTLFFEVLTASTRDPELAKLRRALLAGRTGPTRAIYDNARARGELAPDIDYATMLDIVQGPFVVRSISRPETLADVDVEALAERMLVTLAP